MIIVITPPEFIPREESIINRLFENGLHLLHLRKPEGSHKDYENLIQKIFPAFRSRIVIHNHFDLVKTYGLKGVHLKYEQVVLWKERKEYRHVSVSCHSTEEIDRIPFHTDYLFLSPVFDSISKPGYQSKFDPDTLKRYLRSTDKQIIALGGVDADRVSLCRKMGFAGVALLGYLWSKPDETISRFLKLFPTPVLSIAGFDPSSGAGISSDIKTFENCGVYGLGICTAITFQNQNEYLGTHWSTFEEIIRQGDIILKEFSPRVIKIGLIKDFNLLDQIVTYLKQKLPQTKIIWDPILKASTGFEFHQLNDQNKLISILRKIYLITPNAEELSKLFSLSLEDPEETVLRLQSICQELKTNILWKGGHNREECSTDRLITATRGYSYSVSRNKHDKHGTGCVLSAVITSRLAQGYSLPEACREGQDYVSAFIQSNDTRLGIHHPPYYPLFTTDLHKFPLQYITDFREDMSIPEQVEAVCKGGIRWIQLRMKETDRSGFIETGLKVKAICQKYKALFIINDRVDIALELDADGIHLGKEDMNPLEARKILGNDKIIGATCNTFEDILIRSGQRVDYIGLGPFTYTTTKKKLSPVLGLEGYQNIMESCRKTGITIPVHAIGGIKEKDISPLFSTGISGIALSSLIKNSQDPTTKTEEIIHLIINKNSETWNHLK
ncbi:thiamine phosphate synthase [uncultured Sanguibacteroides sp.]|uniref:thiamine phosphate synthase n=1 Tax=uncultured Sanguibacteroides sp. TaxID=1635151 RepID=UPI0025FF756E|nr:thiamine phosphate synthase [uncultured Sanguibacteroides sp.]